MSVTLILLALFWKPIYYVGMYAWKRNHLHVDHLKLWFISLWSLVNPVEIVKENTNA